MEEQKSSSNMSEIDIASCAINSVTVYKDRAEVQRSLAFSPQRLGEHVVNIVSLTMLSDAESIRVKGTSSCSIMEVSHEIASKREDEVSTKSIIDLNDKIKLLKQNVEDAERQIIRFQKQSALVQSYADTAVRSETKVDLQSAIEVINYHTAEIEKLDLKESVIRAEIKNHNSDIALCNEELSKLKAAVKKSGVSTTSRTISIILNASSLETTCIAFSYVVTNATWSPSYDMRVDTTECALQLHYFAEVTQMSGENWNDTLLLLSTSNPAIGSTPPPLRMKTVQFDRGYNTASTYSKSKKSKSSWKSSNQRDYQDNYSDDSGELNAVRRGSFALLNDDIGFAAAETTINDRKADFAVTGVFGTGDAGSTTFTVQRRVSIECDNKPHKVTVMISTMYPQLVHYAAPSVSPFVYLQAKVQNNSAYPLLSSNKVSVYLDGNFVSTTSLAQANATEHFNVYLGVDPAVKVDYLPVRILNRVKGWLGGTEEKKYFHSTVVNNTKSTMCKLILVEVLPRSPDEKIEVELLEPTVASLAKQSADSTPITSERDIVANLDAFNGTNDLNASQTTPSAPAMGGSWPKDFVTLNKYTNQMVWLKTIRANEKVEVKFNYRICYPQGQNISIS